jgi:hypothetical protein
MFSQTPLLSCHIKSAVKHANYLEVRIETEHLRYQVVFQGTLMMVVDRIIGLMVPSDDPMWSALNQFLHRNGPRIKELIA